MFSLEFMEFSELSLNLKVVWLLETVIISEQITLVWYPFNLVSGNRYPIGGIMEMLFLSYFLPDRCHIRWNFS